MELIDKILEAIFELESLNSRKEDIKITTSFITKRVLEYAIRDYSYHHITELDAHRTKITGVEISFDHYSNDIVIYDETRACLDEKYKIKLKLK